MFLSRILMQMSSIRVSICLNSICQASQHSSGETPVLTVKMVEIGEEDVRITPPEFKNGRYSNPSSWPTFKGLPGWSRLMGWPWAKIRGKISEGGSSRVPWGQPEIIEKEIPVKEPKFDIPVKTDSFNCTWIGHATTVVQMDGFTIVTDPMWSDRCSPLSCAGPKRYRPTPCTINELPRVDIAVISHNHYDHLDYQSVRKIEAEFGGPDGVHWFVPVGIGDWMRKRGGCRTVTELSWADERTVNSPHTGQTCRVVCLPAQHYCLRSGFDRNKALWSGWGLIGEKHRYFFAGDTGYTTEFKNIGKIYGPFDLAAIPIGAYCPRDLMSSQHTDPKGAVQIHRDLRAKRSIGVHWGTFEMGSTEYYLEPRSDLQKQVIAAGLLENVFITTPIGETWNVNYSINRSIAT